MNSAAPPKPSQYQYTRLAPDQIRILEILQVEPLVLTRLLEHQDDTKQEYCALSYAWGAVSVGTSIECDGQSLDITPHLLEGLKSIYVTTGVSFIWVDAICINQADDDEKAVQVAKMHHIYRKAKSVVVWLGAAQDGSDLAMNAIANVKEIPRLPENEDDILIAILRNRSNAPILFSESVFLPMARLSDRPWFFRLWIAQEYFCARQVTFCCGRKILSDDVLITVLRSLSIHSFGRSLPASFKDEDEENLFRGFRVLLGLHKLKDKKENLGFFDFIMQGRSRQVKEPVDRVYAAFGMAESFDAIYRKNIPIDYSLQNRRDYWKTYTVFGKLALMHEPHLRLLSVVESVDRPEALPSWCPNLNSLSYTEPLSSNYSAGWPLDPPEDGREGSDFVDATNRSGYPNFKSKCESHVTVSWTMDVVRIWGARIDTIWTVNRTPVPGSDFDQDNLFTAKTFASEMLAWLDGCENICNGVLPSREQAEWVWQEIMVGTRNNSENRAKSKADMTPYLFMKAVLRQVTALTQENSGEEENPELSKHFEAVNTWIMYIQEQWENRVLFVTNDGRLGFASKRVLEGDLVCMLYAGRLLYTMRQCDTQESPTVLFQFVSETYVFDHMDGEVFDLLKQGLLKEEQFAII